jgi:hypothetical protein
MAGSHIEAIYENKKVEGRERKKTINGSRADR